MSEELVEQITELRDELLRPMMVFAWGRAKAVARTGDPRIVKSGATASTNAAKQIDAIVRAWVDRHPPVS